MITIKEIQKIINYLENEPACESVAIKGNYQGTQIHISRNGDILLTDDNGNSLINWKCTGRQELPITYLYFIQKLEVNAGLRKEVTKSIETKLIKALNK